MSRWRVLAWGVVGAVIVGPAVAAQGPNSYLSAFPGGRSTRGDREFRRSAYSLDTPGFARPGARHEVPPGVTPDAMRAGIRGSVGIEVVIASDGTVTRARILYALDPVHRLDRNALRAVQQWTFTPAMLDGRPVPAFGIVAVPFGVG